MPLRCRFTAALLAVLIVVPLLTFPIGADSVIPSLSAKSAILIDAFDGRVLYELNARVRMPMASTTKIMTALVALEHGKLDDTVEIASDATGVEGSSVYLRVGERWTLRELLYALMLASANDAATAIAIHIGGSVENFACLMNERAIELGLRDTHFQNPHGLDAEGHYTSAYDLALLTAEALKNRDFLAVVSTPSYTVSGNGADGARYLTNHNRMLRTYSGAIGVKTGYTKKSGRCLVTAAERGGLRLVAVTLSAPDDWNDHKKLLDFGFEYYRAYKFGNAGDVFYEVPLVSGDDYSVFGVLKADVIGTVLRYGGQITYVVEAPRFLWRLPKDGDVIGRVVFLRNGEYVAEGELAVKLKYGK